jgi:hypothetical protein
VSWRRTRYAALGLAVFAVSLTACSGSAPHTQSPPSAAPTTPTTSASIDPRLQPAVTVYLMFQDTIAQAEGRPVVHPSTVVTDAYTFDPLHTELERYIWGLASQHIAFRGPSGTSHPVVTSSDLAASPYPSVTIRDCRTGIEQHSYNTKTDAQLPDPTFSAAPPFAATAVVIKYKGAWGVQSFKTDQTRTCRP